MTFLSSIRGYDPEMAAFQHVSHFGAAKTSTAIPVLEGNFPGTALDTKLWTKTEENSATVTVAQGVGSMQCGTNSAGSCKLMSVRRGVFQAGQVTTFQSGVYAGTGLANNVRRWGLMDQTEQNGLFFQWNGTLFQVVARKAGTDTSVSSASFNGENDWTPSAANNTFRIFYSAGRAIFCR